MKESPNFGLLEPRSLCWGFTKAFAQDNPQAKALLRVANLKGETLLCDPQGGFWLDEFPKKIFLEFHIFIK